MAEGYGLNPAELHEDLLQQALAAAEAELNETLAQLDESAEAVDAGRWITVDELDRRLTALGNTMRAERENAGQSQKLLKPSCQLMQFAFPSRQDCSRKPYTGGLAKR